MQLLVNLMHADMNLVILQDAPRLRCERRPRGAGPLPRPLEAAPLPLPLPALGATSRAAGP